MVESGTGSRQRIDFAVPGPATVRGAALVVALMLLALLAVASPDSLSAQANALEIFSGRVGSYQIAVAVQPEAPKVGPVHFSISLTDAETSLGVTDATIVIIANDEGGEPTYQAPALNTPRSPQSYEANISFLASGRWTVEVRVESAGLGPAVVSVPLDVEKLSIAANSWGALVLLGLIAVLIGGAAYVGYSARRARRGRQA